MSSSSENEHIPQYSSKDLPPITIPSPYESSTSSCSSPRSPTHSTPTVFEFATPSQPGAASPTLPDISSPSGSGTPFSTFALSCQTSTDSESGAAKPSRKKSHGSRFVKGIGPKRKLSFTPTPKKRFQVSRPKSSLFTKVHFHRPDEKYTITCKKGDKSYSRDLLIPHGSQIIDMDILGKVFNMMPCTNRSCYGHLTIYQYSFRDGLQSYFLVKCMVCHLVAAEFPSSLPIGSKAVEAINDSQMLTHKKCEVNYRALLAAHTTSASWKDFVLTCNILGIVNTWRDLPQKSLAKLVESTAIVCKNSMDLAAANVYADSEDSNVPNCKNCAVSFDATWHRRGHYSNQGFAAAIEIETGKVLDYQLYERVCNKCLRWSSERKAESPEEYADFWRVHSSTCPANFTGSSQSMESAAALAIWGRSVSRNQLAYTTYIGDGDSSSFKRLSDSNPYDSLEVVRKEECLGHTQKRLKSHLKKASSKTITSNKIGPTKTERVGHLYALVIVQNRGKTPAEIQHALYVLLDHLIEKHDGCPYSTNSWCYARKNQAQIAEDEETVPVVIPEPYLTPPELHRVRHVFKKFASLAMCGTLTLGKTQNANESLHSVLWHNAPKTKRVGQKSLQASASLAVASFNDGSLILACVLAELGVNCTYNTLVHFAKMDKERNRSRVKAIDESQKRRRRVLKAQFIAAEASRKRREKPGEIYKSKAFGSELASKSPMPTTSTAGDSDYECTECRKHDCPKGRKGKKVDWVCCEFCDLWYHAKCMKVTIKQLGDDPFRCFKCEEQEF